MRNWITAFFLILALAPVARSEDRLAGIPELILNGRAAEARPRLAAALAAYRAESDARGEAIALLATAFADVALDDREQSRKNCELAAEKLAAIGDRFTAWMALLFVAGGDMYEENWESAAESHRRALAVLQETGDTPISFDAFIALGPMFNMDLGPLAPLLTTQPEFVKPLLLRMAELMSRDALGATYVQIGQLDKAEEELRRASDLSAMFFGMYDAPVAAHVGDLRRRQWRFDEAKASYRKALGNVKALPNYSFRPDGEELDILEQLSDIELLSGRVDEALAWNDRSLLLIRKRKKPAHEASVLSDRATLLMRAGRFADALQVLGEARKLAAGSPALLASILTDEGAIQMYSGNYGTAAATLEQAIALYQKLENPSSEGYSWMILSQVYMAMAAEDSAKMAIRRVRELTGESQSATARALAGVVSAMEKLHGGREVISPEDCLEFIEMACAIPGADPIAMRQVSGMFGFGDWIKGTELVRAGKFAEARAGWQKALETTPLGELRTGYLAVIAATYWREGNAAEAIAWFRKAVESMERPIGDIADDELLARYLGGNRRWFYELTIEMLVATGQPQDAFDYAERARSRAFLQLIGNHRVAPDHGGSEALLREAESLRVQIAEWERRGSPIVSDLENARERYRLLLRRVKSSNPEYASLTTIEPLRVEAVQRELPPDATLVSYFVTTKRMHTWVIDRESFHHVVSELDQPELRRALCWARRFTTGGRGVRPPAAECDDAATSEEVFDLLVAPVRDKLRMRRLIIVPHGALHYVPFGALRDPQTGRYLIDDHTITFAPSASSLRFLRAKETPVDGSALVIGSPDSSMGALPGAQREADAVARYLQTTPFLGASAAETLLYNLRGEVDLVHIGAHGKYVAASPTFSRIALAPGDGHDGNLEVHEILGKLDLSGVNLVVLSACQTGLGERSGGDDVVGLTRAILYAGSPGVISTLWDINDDAAAVLMDEFYCRLRAGVPAADALRDAQLALRWSGSYGDPRFWAAFIVTGDPQGRWSR